MPEEKDYISRVYMTLQENVDGFTKTEEEFRSAIRDKGYVNKVYMTLRESIDGFDKTENDFISALGKPSAATRPGGGGGLPSTGTPGVDGGRSQFGMGSIAEKIGQPPKAKQPVPPATMPRSNKKEKLEFEERFHQPDLNIKNTDGSTSTHKMASAEVEGKYIAFPTIVNVNNQLKELPIDDAIDYAIKTGEFKEFKTQEEAQQYAEGGYKKGTPLDEFGVGSIVQNIGSSSTSKPVSPPLAPSSFAAPNKIDLSGLPPLEQALGRGDKSAMMPTPKLAVPAETMELTPSGKMVYNPLKDYERRTQEIEEETDVDRQTIKKKELWEDVAKYSQEDNREIEGFLNQAVPQIEQMKAQFDAITQELQNPELDEQQRVTLEMQAQELQGVLQSNADELIKLENKYKQNASLSAQLIKASKGLRYNDTTPLEIVTKEVWNGTVPAIIKSVGGILESGARLPGGMPSLVDPETGEIINPTFLQSVGSALITGANDMQAEYQSTDADVSVFDDLNASNIAKLAGSVLSSFAVVAGAAPLGGASQAVAIGSQVFGNTYEQAKEAGLSPEMAGVFAIIPSLVSAKLAPYGVESIAARLLNPSSKAALREAIKNVGKEGGAKKALELGKEWAKNVLFVEGTTGAIEAGVQYSEEAAFQQLPNIDFGNDETLKGFMRAVGEGYVTEAAGAGILQTFLTAAPRRKLSDIASSAIKDPAKEQKFFDDLKSLLDNNDINQEQFDAVSQEYQKAKAAAAQVPPTVTNPQQSARATELIQEQQELQAQIEQTNPAMVAPLEARLDEVNAELGNIAEGKEAPAEAAAEEAGVAEEVKPQAGVVGGETWSNEELLTNLPLKKDGINDAPMMVTDPNDKFGNTKTRYIPFSIIEKAQKNDRLGGQTAKQIADRGGYSDKELDRKYPNWRKEVTELNKPKAEDQSLKAAEQQPTAPEIPPITAADFEATDKTGKAGRKARQQIREQYGTEAAAKMEYITKNFEEAITNLEKQGKIRKICP